MSNKAFVIGRQQAIKEIVDNEVESIKNSLLRGEDERLRNIILDGDTTGKTMLDNQELEDEFEHRFGRKVIILGKQYSFLKKEAKILPYQVENYCDFMGYDFEANPKLYQEALETLEKYLKSFETE